MLKRIKIRGYKSLVALEVNLEHLAVLIGPNASGKSNFLDALQLLSRIATNRSLKEAFASPYRGYPLESFTFGKAGIESLLEQEIVSFSIEVDVELSPTVIDTVSQQIRNMKGTTAPKVSHESSLVSKQPLPVSETNLRYRIEIEILS
jgi:predicted ATPase